MSAPDPRANPILLGHEAAEQTLLDAIQLGRMHHAWLMTGPEGIGKATLAFRFARRLLAGESKGSGEGASGERSLVLDPAHPVFRRGGDDALLRITSAPRARNLRRCR